MTDPTKTKATECKGSVITTHFIAIQVKVIKVKVLQ